MAMFSRRPAALAHLSDEAAARALSKHFGDIKKAAIELGVARTDLSRLTWSNPAILDAAHERMSLFVLVRRDEIISGLYSKRGSVRRHAIDRMAANPGLFGDLFAGGLSLLSPAAHARGRRSGSSLSEEARGRLARERLEREAVAELARERAIELEADRRREQEVAADREREPVGGSGRAPARVMTDLRPENARYAGMRRLTRGRR
jgi:hypothetical protein